MEQNETLKVRGLLVFIANRKVLKSHEDRYKMTSIPPCLSISTVIAVSCDETERFIENICVTAGNFTYDETLLRM